QLPTSNLLRELRDLGGVRVTVLACQTSAVPEEVRPGLSGPVQQAVRRAADTLVREHFG
ncbi:MAG: coenzyme F420 hydrogenase, partial [Gemmatimonadales bacterium]|nr:coenzyme F420 hydrogenase [Gemmatimonadales bacterium]